jgi:hypothetical protein
MQNTHDAQYDNHEHAFQCDKAFTDAYGRGVGSGKAPAKAIRDAWKAHDESVEWVLKNVPLN